MILAVDVLLILGCLLIARWLVKHPGAESVRDRGGDLPTTFDYREWR